MKRGSRIVAIGGEGEAVASQENPALTADTDLAHAAVPAGEDWSIEEAPPASVQRWSHAIAPSAAALAIAGWSAFFAWAHYPDALAQTSAQVWIEWIGQWSLPVVLICALWLIAMRASRREAGRFVDASRVLAAESLRLEARIRRVNEELSLAREFLGSQGRELESLGRIASERLSQNAEHLQSLIASNGQQVETIASVSVSALDNMERLRSQLPVIGNATKDVTNNIAAAGRSANAQLMEMISGFKKLNEFGQASERQVLALRGHVSNALNELGAQAEQIETLGNDRLAALAGHSADFRARLDVLESEAAAAIRLRAEALSEELALTGDRLSAAEAECLDSLRARLMAVREESGAIARSIREAEAGAIAAWQGQLERMTGDVRGAIADLEASDHQAIEAARARFAALAEETMQLDARIAERGQLFAQEAEQRRAEVELREDEAIVQMRARIARLDTEIAACHARQQEQATLLAAQGSELINRVDTFAERLEQAVALGEASQVRLGSSIADLGERLDESRRTLGSADRELATLTDASVRLLELIRASARYSEGDLRAAISDGEARLAQMENRIFTLKASVEEARGGSESLSSYVLASQQGIADARKDMGLLHDLIARRNDEHASAFAQLGESLNHIAETGRRTANEARHELKEAIALLEQSAGDAVAAIQRDSAEEVARLAGRIGEESRTVLERVLRTRAGEVAGELEQAVAQAADVSRKATLQLRDQLAIVNELVGNLETRVAHARQQAEERLDNDFARRVALITDSLNSNAIDLAKALSTDVADTAWAAYLRGDRGIFTRRAVSLIDQGEARAIVHVYEHDRDFRDQVNRYIHDFEGMLRQLLSTRDGHALGVTLLSSDIGKLYVALAQAIERLRK